MKPTRQEVSAITAALSSHIAGALRKPLLLDVAERARLHLVDTLAAMISGSRLLPGRGEMAQRLEATFECFARETAQGPRVLTVPLHPHLMGVPHRIAFLENFLGRLRRREDAVFMTGGDIADWFVAASA